MGHYTKIPIKQPVFHGKLRKVFFVAHLGTKRGSLSQNYPAFFSPGMVGRSLVLDVQLEDGSVEELPSGLVRLQELG